MAFRFVSLRQLLKAKFYIILFETLYLFKSVFIPKPQLINKNMIKISYYFQRKGYVPLTLFV